MGDRIGTHSESCWSFGPRHYECATRRVSELEAKLATAVGALAEIAKAPRVRVMNSKAITDAYADLAAVVLASIQERT